MTNSTMVTFNATITELNQALSFVPRIKSMDISTTITAAGKLAMPWTTVPSPNFALSKGDSANWIGKSM